MQPARLRVPALSNGCFRADQSQCWAAAHRAGFVSIFQYSVVSCLSSPIQDKPDVWMSWTKVHAITERECTSFMEQHGVSRRTAEQLFGLDVLADVSSRARHLSSADSRVFLPTGMTREPPECMHPGGQRPFCHRTHSSRRECRVCQIRMALNCASSCPCERLWEMLMQQCLLMLVLQRPAAQPRPCSGS